MKRMAKYSSVLVVLSAIGYWVGAAAALTFKTIDDPLGTGFTEAFGISGSNIVGAYNSNASGYIPGFLYNGSTYTTLNGPLGAPHSAQAFGISGNNIVGYYTGSIGSNHGFLYNELTSTYTTLDDPLASHSPPQPGYAFGTSAYGISGNNIVGSYIDYIDSSFNSHGFLYNGSNYQTLDDPLAGQ